MGSIEKLRRAEIALRNAEAAERLAHIDALRCLENYRDALREAVVVERGRAA